MPAESSEQTGEGVRRGSSEGAQGEPHHLEPKPRLQAQSSLPREDQGHGHQGGEERESHGGLYQGHQAEDRSQCPKGGRVCLPPDFPAWR